VATRTNSGPSPVMLGVIGIGAVVLAGGVWYLQRGPAMAPPPAAITPEAKAYVRNLRLSDVGIKATESYGGQQVVEILGKITNAGDRVLNAVEVNCVFYDPYGQVVLRERIPIVRNRGAGLKPGETRPFRLPFDTLPGSWNQGAPQLVIAAIQFG